MYSVGEMIHSTEKNYHASGLIYFFEKTYNEANVLSMHKAIYNFPVFSITRQRTVIIYVECNGS